MPQEDSHNEGLGGEGRERREQERRERDVRLRVGLRLRELSDQLDRPSYDLLLRVLGGVNAAFTRRNEHVELEMTSEERALYTPELQRELVRLLEMACIPPQRVRTDDCPPPGAP